MLAGFWGQWKGNVPVGPGFVFGNLPDSWALQVVFGAWACIPVTRTIEGMVMVLVLVTLYVIIRRLEVSYHQTHWTVLVLCLIRVLVVVTIDVLVHRPLCWPWVVLKGGGHNKKFGQHVGKSLENSRNDRIELHCGFYEQLHDRRNSSKAETSSALQKWSASRMPP